MKSILACEENGAKHSLLLREGLRPYQLKYQQLIAFGIQFCSTILCFTAFQRIFQLKNDRLCFLLCKFVTANPSLNKRGDKK